MNKKLKIASMALATITILNLTACEPNEAENVVSTTVPTEYRTEVVVDEEGRTQINTYPVTQSVANAQCQTQNVTKAIENSDSKVSQNVSKTVANNSTKTTTAKKSSQSSSSKQQKTTTKTTTKTTVKYAGKGDERAVAQAVIKWINYYRVQEGKKAAIEMPGKATQYAVGRSKQLVTNFDHDLIDEKTLAKSMKYGYCWTTRFNSETKVNEPLDPSEYEYRPELSSAIYRGGWAGQFPLDEVAGDIARGFRSSKGHWSYVGDADGDGYNYIAVGVSIGVGNCWCVDVEMAKENIDNTGYYSR